MLGSKLFDGLKRISTPFRTRNPHRDGARRPRGFRRPGLECLERRELLSVAGWVASATGPDEVAAVDLATDRRCLVVLVWLSLLGLGGMLFAPPAEAAIYRWDNGALITDLDAVPYADFSWIDLGYADLVGASLFDASFSSCDLTRAHLMDADLTRAIFNYATLTDADLSGAVVTGARFGYTTSSGFTAAQLYSTASYQSGDLSGIELGSNDLSGWHFAGKTLTGADFRYATLTGAELSGAVVTGAGFSNTTSRGFTAAQLYSTATYQSGDLSGIGLGGNDLSGWHSMPLALKVV